MNDEAFFKKLEDEGMLVNSIESLGWGFWPSTGGYFDEITLRILADEIERRNKPFWDEYEQYCRSNQATEDAIFDSGTDSGTQQCISSADAVSES